VTNPKKAPAIYSLCIKGLACSLMMLFSISVLFLEFENFFVVKSVL